MDFPREKCKTVNNCLIIKLAQGFKLFLTFVFILNITARNVQNAFTMVLSVLYNFKNNISIKILQKYMVFKNVQLT